MFEDIFQMVETRMLEERIEELMLGRLITPTYLSFCSREIYQLIGSSSILRQKFKDLDLVTRIVESHDQNRRALEIYIVKSGHRLGAEDLYHLCD